MAPEVRFSLSSRHVYFFLVLYIQDMMFTCTNRSLITNNRPQPAAWISCDQVIRLMGRRLMFPCQQVSYRWDLQADVQTSIQQLTGELLLFNFHLSFTVRCRLQNGLLFLLPWACLNTIHAENETILSGNENLLSSILNFSFCSMLLLKMLGNRKNVQEGKIRCTTRSITHPPLRPDNLIPPVYIRLQKWHCVRQIRLNMSQLSLPEKQIWIPKRIFGKLMHNMIIYTTECLRTFTKQSVELITLTSAASENKSMVTSSKAQTGYIFLPNYSWTWKLLMRALQEVSLLLTPLKAKERCL